MRITVLQRGRIKDALVKAYRDEYVKRFRRYGELAVTERGGETDEASIFPAARAFRIAFDERGKMLSSEEFARSLEKWSMTHGAIQIAIGSGYGHSPATLAQADQKLSLGPMTLNHMLAHLVALEQIYRAATILRGEPYHHA